MRFLGANQEACLQEEEPLPGKVNYLLGNDPSKWHTDLPTYKGIRYSSLYPGVSLTYSGEARRLKGTYTVSPGADPGIIKWRYEGASSVKVDSGGNLQITISGSKPKASEKSEGSTLTELAPSAWQEIGAGAQRRRVPVAISYTVGSDG